jgi:hypothetical protein
MRSLALPALAGVALSFSAANADTISLQASRDNTLIENVAGSLSDGSGPTFFVGQISQGTVRRGLLRFDLSPIPAGSTITAVSLTLNASQTQGPATDISLHRTLADWGEGASSSIGGGGAPAQPGDATWLHTFFDTAFWTTPGGDFSPGASATQSVLGPGSYTWSSTSELVADAQAWLDNPASNFGWTLTGLEGTNGTAKRFDSRENLTEANRPVLNVEYTIPAPPAAGLFALSLIARRRRRP